MADKVIRPVLRMIQYQNRLWKPGEYIIVDADWVNDYGPDYVGDPAQSSQTHAPTADSITAVVQAEAPAPPPLPEPAPAPVPRFTPKRT